MLPLKAQDHPNIVLLPESILKISGLTNINSFSLTYLVKNNAIKIFPEKTIAGIENLRDCKVDMNLPFKGFESDNPSIKHDFLELVQEDHFPTMHINIPHICIITSLKSGNVNKSNVEITIKGVTRNYDISFHNARYGKELITSGHQKIDIRDFRIEPPRKFFGLIKVNEILDIDFQLYMQMSNTEYSYLQ
jgi:hypothetical protein